MLKLYGGHQVDMYLGIIATNHEHQVLVPKLTQPHGFLQVLPKDQLITVVYVISINSLPNLKSAVHTVSKDVQLFRQWVLICSDIVYCGVMSV